jgi:hypothetical protein
MCGRVGLLSRTERGKQAEQVVIHSGRVIDGLLEGIDSCRLTNGSTSSAHKNAHEKHLKNNFA